MSTEPMRDVHYQLLSIQDHSQKANGGDKLLLVSCVCNEYRTLKDIRIYDTMQNCG
jgi:hypothetical protein